MNEVGLGGTIQDLSIDEVEMVDGADGVVESAVMVGGAAALVGGVVGGPPGALIGAGIGMVAGAIIHFL